MPHEIAARACGVHAALQRVDELTEAVAVAARLKPRVIVEIGCMDGGTLYAWRQICDRVYGITLPEAPRSWSSDHGAVVHLGDSHDRRSLEWLAIQLDGDPVDVLHIDGDHSYEGVKADWDMYAPLVRRGGLVFLHDVLNTYQSWVEVPRFWQELMAARPRSTSLISSHHKPLGFGVVTI